jgi:hypothetical protein
MQKLLDAYQATGSIFRAAEKIGVFFTESPVGYYVYALTDPADGSVFYVGKGKGSRRHQHVRNALRGRETNAGKAARIVSIIERGDRPAELVLEDGLAESEAYEMEREWILALMDRGLTNISTKGFACIGSRRAEAVAMLSKIPYVGAAMASVLALPDYDSEAVYEAATARVDELGAVPTGERFLLELIREAIKPTPRTVTLSNGSQPVFGY